MGLPDTLKPLFAASAAITIGLDALANAATVISTAVDNSSNLYDEILLQIYIDGTAAATAWLDVRIAICIDGTNYSTWESSMKLPAIDLSVDLQYYHARFAAPQRWKLMVKNNTGASLNNGNNTAAYQGINMQVID